MKPAVQVSSPQRNRIKFPLIDWQYHDTLETTPAGAKTTRVSKPLRPIWKLSAEFLGFEAARDYVTELTLFCLITGLSAWPSASMLWAVVRMIRNY
jgi:hypothetical protein